MVLCITVCTRMHKNGLMLPSGTKLQFLSSLAPSAKNCWILFACSLCLTHPAISEEYHKDVQLLSSPWKTTLIITHTFSQDLFSSVNLKQQLIVKPSFLTDREFVAHLSVIHLFGSVILLHLLSDGNSYSPVTS